MKNVIIVSKGNVAVAVGKDMPSITKTGVGTFTSNLEVLKELLTSIPVEASETVHIYVPDLIQGIVSGGAIEYVKTGKTTSGNALTAEEITGFKEFYKLYAERILNVRFSQFRYIAKDNAELQALKKQAWDVLNSNSVASAVVTTQTVDPDKAIREAIDAQIVKALESGNMEMFTMLKAERDKLKQPEIVQVTSQATNTNAVQIHGVNFEEASNVFSNTEEEPIEDTPIDFVEEPAKEISW